VTLTKSINLNFLTLQNLIFVNKEAKDIVTSDIMIQFEVTIFSLLLVDVYTHSQAYLLKHC